MWPDPRGTGPLLVSLTLRRSALQGRSRRAYRFVPAHLAAMSLGGRAPILGSLGVAPLRVCSCVWWYEKGRPLLGAASRVHQVGFLGFTYEATSRVGLVPCQM